MVGCRNHESRRRAAGEYTALFAVTDPETGETGHFVYFLAWDKRDVVDESVLTDNPALVVEDDSSPGCYSAFQMGPDKGEEPTKHPAFAGCTINAWEDPT
jgi:hypothetical protein